MRKILALGIFLLSFQAVAQTKELTVKSSASEDALIELSKDYNSVTKSYNDAFQQARTTLDATTKDLAKEIQTKQTDLQTKLEGDKRYKPLLDEIKDLQNKYTSANKDASDKFNKVGGPLQTQQAQDSAQILAIKKIVKKEQSLPDDADFDAVSGKWTVLDKKTN